MMAKDDMELTSAERRWANRSLFRKRKRHGWRIAALLIVLGGGLLAALFYLQEAQLLHWPGSSDAQATEEAADLPAASQFAAHSER